MEQLDRIPKLIAGHLRGDLSATEQKELDAWINESEANSLFFLRATDERTLPDRLRQFMKYDMEGALRKTLQEIAPETKVISMSRFGRFKKYMVAACLLVIAGAGIYYITGNRVSTKKDIAKTPSTINTKNNDVQPGTEKAVLTLSDGTKITLDNTTNGTIAQQGNTVVMKEDGLLAYNVDKRKSQAAILYNTLTTARGEEFRSLVLSDGTKVWLNSISSIHFPTAFTGKERIVEITGEVYFEVTKNPSHPFRVFLAPPPAGGGGMQVEVLGTHFNINAYSDEAVIKTTLLEGSVKVVNGKSLAMIKPGQQAQVTSPNGGGREGAIKVINDADVNAAVAWKNGLLVFNKTDIKTILRQVSRWYDVDIEYKGDIKVPNFYGKIPRTVTLSEVFKIIEINSNLQFTIEGKKVTVNQP